MTGAAECDAVVNTAQEVVLPRGSKRPRFQTQSLGDSDEESSGGRWEGTGGLLQYLNSGDELKTDNPKWKVWTPQTAGTQYAEPPLAPDADKSTGGSAALDSKEVGKKSANDTTLRLHFIAIVFILCLGTMRWPLVPATALSAKTSEISTTGSRRT
jgi:hypothetical protein